MTIFHGTLFYAVRSRTVGTFGGRAAKATVKIYHSSNAGSPACVLNEFGQMSEFMGLVEAAGDDRVARDAVMAEFVKFGG